MLRRNRFPGAGASSERKFSRLRAENMAEEWKLWLGATGLSLGFIVWSEFAVANAARMLDVAAGLVLGVLLVLWGLGGHISAFRWRLGAMGEQDTAREIEKLGPGWHCEHDVVHEHGNWDHVLVGPPGTFVLDSKLLHGRAVAGRDTLRAGRLSFSGRAVRGAAVRVKHLIEHELGQPAGWVQGVVVVWGDFPQRRHEEEFVVYVAGEELVSWLHRLEPRLNQPQLAARVTAVRQLRARLEPGA